MPLEFDLDHLIPDTLKHCDRQLREKDERILSLEAENAMLYLKLAKLQGDLKKQKRHEFSTEETLKLVKQRELNYSKCLNGFLAQIKELRDELKSLRSAVATMPSTVAHSVDGWALEQLSELEHSLRAGANDYRMLQQQVSDLQRDLLTAQERYMKEKVRRRQLHNNLVELRGNIRVHCRVRPVLHYDMVSTSISQGRHGNSSEEIVFATDDENVGVVLTKAGHPQTSRNFEFERVYHPSDLQDEVFQEVQPLLTSLLDGYNVCIMAYGQTGSGKTHTMLGGRYTDDLSQTRAMLDENKQDGVVPRAARELFRLLREKSSSYTTEVSVVEVYNNEIRDLLTLNSASSRHDIFTSDDGSMEVPSLIQRPVTTAVEIVDLVRHGMIHRHEDTTQIHAHSSRSHLVVNLTVTVIQSPSHRSSKGDDQMQSSCKEDQEVLKTKLQLVDLAGSECVGMSGVTGSALRETSHINRSLSALADVLAALAEGRSHVPYRNSKLTHLMRDSIGGDAKLLVICCVSPTHRYLTETLQCLGFGSRARQIQRGQVKKRNTTLLSGAGDQSPVISARGKAGQRHSVSGSAETAIPLPKFKTSPMMQRRSSHLDNFQHSRSGRTSPGKPR